MAETFGVGVKSVEIPGKMQLRTGAALCLGPGGGVVSGWSSVFSFQFSVVSGQWSVVSGQWSVVSGQWSVVSGQFSVFSAREVPPWEGEAPAEP